MSLISIPNDEFDEYANYLGLTGIDIDVFYEAYYQMNDENDYVDIIDDHYRVYWWKVKYYLSASPTGL